MSRGQRGLFPWFTGESCTITVTSGFTTIAEIPGTARNTVFEIYLSASTKAESIDARLMQAMPRLEAQTSDLNFKFAATTITAQSSSFTFSTTKNAYAFALQVKQSTNTTNYTRTAYAKWIGIG